MINVYCILYIDRFFIGNWKHPTRIFHSQYVFNIMSNTNRNGSYTKPNITCVKCVCTLYIELFLCRPIRHITGQSAHITIIHGILCVLRKFSIRSLIMFILHSSCVRWVHIPREWSGYVSPKLHSTYEYIPSQDHAYVSNTTTAKTFHMWTEIIFRKGNDVLATPFFDVLVFCKYCWIQINSMFFFPLLFQISSLLWNFENLICSMFMIIHLSILKLY